MTEDLEVTLEKAIKRYEKIVEKLDYLNEEAFQLEQEIMVLRGRLIDEEKGE